MDNQFNLIDPDWGILLRKWGELFLWIHTHNGGKIIGF